MARIPMAAGGRPHHENDSRRVSFFDPHCGPLPMALLINLAIILVFGIVMLFSASYTTGYLRMGDSYYYIKDQSAYLVLGSVAALVISCVDYHWLRKFTNMGYLFSLLLLALVLTCEPINGCRRWLHWSTGPLKFIPSIQVSEFVKFVLILYTAQIICKYRNLRKPLDRIRYGIFAPVLPLIPIVALMLMEPHVSGTVIMIAIVGSMMLFGGSGGPWLWLIGLGGGGVLLAAFTFLSDLLGNLLQVVSDRLGSWTDDITQMSDQTLHSLYAIGSGGVSGLGLGNSLEKQIWLPECVNDFIFSVVCEELGFIGACIVILLFVLLVAQCLYYSFEAPDYYGTLLGLGISAQIGWQVFFNIGVVTNTLPNTGISLPFFSSGGTSLLILLGEMGVLLSIARRGARAKQLAAEAKAAQEAAQAAVPNKKPAAARSTVEVPKL